MKFLLIAVVALASAAFATTPSLTPIETSTSVTPSNGTEVDHPRPPMDDSMQMKNGSLKPTTPGTTQRMEESTLPVETSKKTEKIEE